MATAAKTEKPSHSESTEGTPKAKGGKLARRARSFKEDFLDILAQMRSPTGARTGSPKPSPKHRTTSGSEPPPELERNPLRDLDVNVKQMQFALKHFRDVVARNKLEVIPGNGTIVLENVTTIHSILKNALIDQSSALVSATDQVYQSLAKLIRLCDDMLFLDNKAISKDNVTVVVQQVEDAVQNLVTVATAKIAEQNNEVVNHSGPQTERSSSHALEFSRSSLPDIPLTPRECEILEKSFIHRTQNHSHSSESVLHDSIPPPKPPLPYRIWGNHSPPPLPPKRGPINMPAHSLEQLSLRSNSSLGSVDSMFNVSLKDDDELQALPDEDSSINFESVQHSHGLGDEWPNGTCSCWDSSCSTISQAHESPDIAQLPGERISSSPGFMSVSSCCQNYNFSSIKSTSMSSYESKTQIVSLSSTRIQEVTSESYSTGKAVTPPALPLKQRTRRSQYDNVPSYDNASPTHPPPIPLKRKHIMAYMEMFGNCSQPNSSEYLRHSVHTYSVLQAEWQQHQMSLTASHNSWPDGTTTPRGDDLPPALPPKQRNRPTPPPTIQDTLPVKGVREGEIRLSQTLTPTTSLTNGSEESPLDMLDVCHLLVLKKDNEEGPDIRGGDLDALIVHATRANKNDFLYQEAFLTTYRTFLTPLELLEKLCRRHDRFSKSPNPTKQRSAREAFSLLVRVVSDLTTSDFEPTVVEMLTSFVYQLLCRGDLIMAKALRVKTLEKYNIKRLNSATCTLLPSQNVYTRQASLFDFKPEQIAEQMTLLDSELFMKIEIPEVLIWAQHPNEESSPNLTSFSAHFNKMSLWARSRILEQADMKDREKYVFKFLKIMKHLRKINNFNSYLALLSALESSPIRRLEWPKPIIETVKEYSWLIDSTSSFRTYRQALAETQPPCIPYIGLVLQDLTFVHMGNNNFISEEQGIINFSKRWQQFNIVENMKRFKKGIYSFKKSERIIAFFNNFDEALCEDAMWEISLSIKPPGNKKAIQ